MQRQMGGFGGRQGLVALVLAASSALSGCTSAPEPVKAVPRAISVRPIILGEEMSGGIYVREDVCVVVSDMYVHVYASPRSPGSAQLYSVELGSFDDSRDGMVVTPDSVGLLTRGRSVRLRCSGSDRQFFITGDYCLGVQQNGFRLVVNPAQDLAVVTYSGGVITNDGPGSTDFSADFDNNAGWNADKVISLLNHITREDNPYRFGRPNPLANQYPVDCTKVRVEHDYLAGTIGKNGELAIKSGNDFQAVNVTVRRGVHEIVVGDTPVRVVSEGVYNLLGGENVVVLGWNRVVSHDVKGDVTVDGAAVVGSVVLQPKKP